MQLAGRMSYFLCDKTFIFYWRHKSSLDSLSIPIQGKKMYKHFKPKVAVTILHFC